MRYSNKISPDVHFIFNGIRYRWNGWLGCQLESYEWFTPRVGTRRLLNFNNGSAPTEVVIFSTQRSGLKTRCTWSVSCSGTHDTHVKRIERLRDELRNLI